MSVTIPADHQYLSIKELLDSGLSYYKINQYVAAGILKKLNKKIYENMTYNGDMSDFATAAAYAPKAVICMMTAARYYGLTTFIPDSVDIAIERSKKISTLPDWPSLRIWYFPEKRYASGITSVEDGSGTYRMYDIEKTVVDILYYRNKVGIEETKEILKNYLDRSDRNINKLHKEAYSLGCGKILSTYLEVLL